MNPVLQNPCTNCTTRGDLCHQKCPSFIAFTKRWLGINFPQDLQHQPVGFHDVDEFYPPNEEEEQYEQLTMFDEVEENHEETEDEFFKEFKDTLGDMYDIHVSKDSDYGNAIDITYLLFGEPALLVRKWDKLLRETQLYLSGKALVKEESFDDTLFDDAVYTAKSVALRRKFKGKDRINELAKAMARFLSKAQEKANEGGE